MKYRIGLDIGIGSVGWAVVSAAEKTQPARIEDFGTRIFESGENEKKRESNCQDRRKHRGVRRLERRKAYRKELLYRHFLKTGLINAEFNDDLAECKDEEIFALKAKALSEKLTTAELFKCMVHTSNHRGYRDFYEPEDKNASDEDDEEESVNLAAANAFEQAFRDSKLRTVSEYILSAYCDGGRVTLRNRSNGAVEHTLIRRELLRAEVQQILTAQKLYHPELTEDAIEKTISIIFRQRDFEDGPGDPNDPNRMYHGFLETLGQCTFYKDEKRGFRGTVISDIYAVINILSQFRYICEATGEYCLSEDIARELVETLLHNADLTIPELKQILKRNGYKLYLSADYNTKALSNSVKFLKKAKESLGDRWAEYIAEEQFDLEHPSRLHQIGELLSTYQTPKRREKEMLSSGIDSAIVKAFSGKKLGGTSNVSYKYMVDAINAFLHGDIYGNFQANTIKQHTLMQPVQRSVKLLPRHIDDPEIRSNRVVFKAINETRKIINAIIDVYGSPEEIVIEVANELGKSFKARSIETKVQRDREKSNENDRNQIASILSIQPDDVRGDMIERYRLFREQEGKCMYSGKPLGEIADVLANANKVYEIDHIVPFSLILDNTLQNKALVFTGENQRKGQRTPLMYLDEKRSKAFKAEVNRMSSRKENPISKKKCAYYLLDSIYGSEAQEVLSGWKSRNINDTRYITKYITGILNRHLLFAGDENKRHVLPVKGVVTQKFRREWLRTTPWGDEKNRESYLNHAIDAVVAANLTFPYIELGSDALRLRKIYYENKKRITEPYREYLEACVSKMEKFYGFQEEYTRELLRFPEKIPSYVPQLSLDIDYRTRESDEKSFQEKMLHLHGREADFQLPLRQPLTSFKQERKFSGAISDDNPVKLVEKDGVMKKVVRKNIQDVSYSLLKNIYTGDERLIHQLENILTGHDDKKYTVGNYLQENGLTEFRDLGGQRIRKVSCIEDKPITNYYRMEKNGGHTYLGGLKYYCIEVYKNKSGQTRTRGIRFVDIVKKNGKLYQKRSRLPADYAEHIMYLQKNDYIRVLDGKKSIKYEGFYQSVFNVNQSQFCFHIGNEVKIVPKSIAPKDSVIKYDVSILGRIGGKVRCSEPLPFIEEKK